VSDGITVAINAQLSTGAGRGGIETFLAALIRALGELDGPEKYLLITSPKDPAWPEDILGRNQEIVVARERVKSEMKLTKLDRLMRLFLNRIIRNELTKRISWPQVPISNGFYEELGCNVIHFPYQNYVLCSIPTVYNPHDLQHLHFPSNFDTRTLAWRDVVYRAGCRLSHTVVTASDWIKQDVIKHFALNSDKVCVIPWAPPTATYQVRGTVQSIREKYDLPLVFAFYPAMIWPHKNHVRLLKALAVLRDNRGVKLSLVLTGDLKQRGDVIQDTVDELNLREQVKFVGLLPNEELIHFYRTAQFVIVPTLFEAASGPVFEAWQENVPVACANVTSLPEQVGKAALLFDPYSEESIAEALRIMATEPERREALSALGRKRLKDFSWERTAKAYRAVYRRAARVELSMEDKQLVGWDWMKSSGKPEKTT